LAFAGSLFGAVGTAGQRCTTLRRLIIHEDIYDGFVKRLADAYPLFEKRMGDPQHPDTLVGPLHNAAAVKGFVDGLATIKAQGGKVIAGGKVVKGNFVTPTLVEIDHSAPVVQ